ncbi:hypothetical protein [Rhizobium sp. L51/94]|uniref:hypothetical protein n=1 Tax=Rhizobium sp. L51/94 TaxID=2819999 RepID=UPI001C5B8767|nr:hypothetical protein [Rhizobium sp. L51/94]QXZ79618.1 hypothetical protein J5274_06445 [Rhizobium sp. L51/94]
MATPQENQQLKALRRRHGEASKDWALGRAGDTLEAVIVQRHPPVAIAVLADDCGPDDRDFLLHAHNDIQLLLRLLDRAVALIRQQPTPSPAKKTSGRKAGASAEGPNFAAECAMRCAEPDFLTFLREEKSIDTTDAERTATGIRQVLNVQSRGDLNIDPAAASRWHTLKGEFDLWSRT